MTGRDVVHTGFAQTDMLYVPLTPGEKRRVESLAKTLGITSLLDRDMQTLSTGELRKVLIARAIVGRPRVLLADEPTGNLDSRMGEEIMTILEDLNAKDGTTVVMVTHDDRFASRTNRIVRLFDGRQVA